MGGWVAEGGGSMERKRKGAYLLEDVMEDGVVAGGVRMSA